MERLTYFDRQRIEFYLRCKLKPPKIAQLIHKDRTIVFREIQRNKSPWFPYQAVIAEKAADRKATITNTRKLLKDERLRWYVERKLFEGWSPEQIEGRIKIEKPAELQGSTIGHEAIYQYIYDEDKGAPWLYHKLRRTHPQRQKRYSRKPNKRTIIPDRTSIELRPEVVNQKQRYGDWESDTMEFTRKTKGYVSVQKERKSHLLKLTKLETKRAEETRKAIEDNISDLPWGLYQTITFDNGGEGAEHLKLKSSYNIETYFCKAYSAWQKGGVENTIGLLRQYLPRKTNLNDLSDTEIKLIEEKLNNRPRKSLNYQTPNEILKEITKNVALNSRT